MIGTEIEYFSWELKIGKFKHCFSTCIFYLIHKLFYESLLHDNDSKNYTFQYQKNKPPNITYKKRKFSQFLLACFHNKSLAKHVLNTVVMKEKISFC